MWYQKDLKVKKTRDKTIITERGEIVIETSKPIEFIKIRRGPYFEYSVRSEKHRIIFEYDPKMINLVAAKGEER